MADDLPEHLDKEDDPMQNDSGINFADEAEKIGDAGNDWFTPPEGTTQVTFLDNGTKTTRTYDEDEGPREVVEFAVEVDGDEKTWTVNKARSKSSLYGQLVRVGAAWNGLEGETVTLIRNGTGSDTQYTVQEAADL